MSSKRQINGRDFVNDIRTGLSDTELMQKYGLSARGLQSIFGKLIDAKAIDPAEIYERSAFGDSTVDVEVIHLSLRGHPSFTPSIYEAVNPEVIGTVRKITEKQLEVVGIEAGFDETKTLIIMIGRHMKVEPVFLKAKCRWCRKEPPGGQHVAGFEITSISEDNLRELKKLIRIVSPPLGS
jgi:hypothetical protein